VFASITITGGAYHEVKRIFAALGTHVDALCRISFGNLVLPEDMAFGQHRPIRPEDVLSE
jgi:16S rRNA pseudouridine516 synthase